MTNKRISNTYHLLLKSNERIHWNDMLGNENKSQATFILQCMRKIELLDFSTTLDDTPSQNVRIQLQGSLMFYNPITETYIAHAFTNTVIQPKLKKF